MVITVLFLFNNQNLGKPSKYPCNKNGIIALSLLTKVSSNKCYVLLNLESDFNVIVINILQSIESIFG